MSNLIIDASIAINWAHELKDLIILEKLNELGHHIILPEKVEDEISGIDEIDLVQHCEVISCNQITYEQISARYFRLGSGEKAVISLGKGFESEGVEYLCVVDDMRARDACEAESLEFTGQIGLLNILIDSGSISRGDAISYLEILEEEGAWLPSDWKSMVKGGN